MKKQIRPKVLLVDHSRYWGGAETCLNNILLDNRDQCDYFLLVDYYSEHNKKFCIDASNRIERFLKAKKWIIKLETLSKYGVFRRTCILLKALMLIPVLFHTRCDIVHFNLFRSNDLLDLIICKLFHKRTVVHVRSLAVRMRIPRYLDYFIDSYVCVSYAVKNGFPHLSAEKTHVIHDGVRETNLSYDKFSARNELNLPANELIFASIGSYEPLKGHDSAIRAFSKLFSEHNDICLLIVGSEIASFPNERARLDGLCRQEGIENKVRFITIPYFQMPILYQAVDIALSLIKDGESFGMIPVEAGLQQCPCVGAIYGAAPEIITEQSGWLIDTQDQNEVDNCFKSIYSHRDTLSIMGENAKKIIKKKFISTKCNLELINLYSSLIH